MSLIKLNKNNKWVVITTIHILISCGGIDELKLGLIISLLCVLIHAIHLKYLT